MASKAGTSYNNIFTLRGIHPSVRPELEVDSGMSISVAGKQKQSDKPAPPSRIATATSWLKVVGCREYNNVRRNSLLVHL